MIKKFIEKVEKIKISKTTFGIVGLFALLAVVAVAVIDTEVNACVNNKTGSVRILNFIGGQCSKSETSLVWNKQGPAGPQGIQGDKGDKGDPGTNGSSLHLYDANNQDLGILIDMQSTWATFFVTYLPVQRMFLSFGQNRDSLSVNVGPAYFGLYFLQENCEGTPYVNDSGNPMGAVISHGNRAFRYTNEDVLHGGQPLSTLEYPTGCLNSLAGAGTLYPMEEITLPFTLPLAWPLTDLHPTPVQYGML